MAGFVLKHYLPRFSQFRRALHTCKCGWSGTGAMMRNGSYSGLGVNKLCPKCGEHHSFAKFSAVVENGTPDDWPPVG